MRSSYPKPRTPSSQPDKQPAPGPVKVAAILGFAAIRAQAGGAWRLWTLARSLDPSGSGFAYVTEVRDLLESLGVSDRTLRRWWARALALGFVSEACHGDRLRYAAPDRVALAVLAEIEADAGDLSDAERFELCQVGNPASIPAAKLVGRGWRAALWAAFVCAHGKRPMSLATAERLTGIPMRTLRRWNAESGVRCRRNLATGQQSADHVRGMIESGVRPSAFVGPDSRAWWRLPDTRTPPRWARSLPHGRKGKINRRIRAASFFDQRGSEHGAVRLFWDRERPAIRALNRSTQIRPEVYLNRRQARREGVANLWRPLASD